jgi:hypothetical protein
MPSTPSGWPLPQREPEKLNVLIFRRRDDYELTLRAHFGVSAIGTGGMFFTSSRGGGLAFWTEGLPRRRIHHVLQHEGFHQFAHSRFGGDLPIWLNEGLAEFFGEAVIVDHQLVIGQSRPRVISAVKDAIETGQYIPFAQMLAMTSERWGQAVRDGGARLQYAQAWSMVQFLAYGDGGRYVEAFERYLRLLNNALPSREAFIRAFGSEDIEGFERRWRSYAERARPSAFITALERIEFLAAGALQLSEQGVRPTTLEALREALREAGFNYKLTMHGLDDTLSAADDQMYLIPGDELSDPENPPRFVVAPATPDRTSRRLRHLEEITPTPPSIATEHLRPRDVAVEWVRDEQTNTFSYQIVVR